MGIRFLNTILLLFVGFVCYSQSANWEVREGNNAFKNNNFEEAEKKYRESELKDASLLENSYNLGGAQYRQGKYEEAAVNFQKAASKTEDKSKRAMAYHNMGNALLKSQKLEESVKAYKNALINNPKDEESRYNLAYAMQQLQQQQEQEKQDKENKEENKDENKEEQENEEKQEEENKEEQDKEQDQQKEEEQKEEEEKKQQEQKEQQVSREDAERILEALQNKEKELQEKLKKKKGKAVKIDIEKDW